MRVALICPTIGQTRRGYERFMTDVFRAIRSGGVDVTLFKGAGNETPDEHLVRHLSRTGILARICGNRLRLARYHLEFATFAAGLAAKLARGRFDLVHFIDPPLARWLAWIRWATGGSFKLLFSNAGPQAYDAKRWIDHIHCLTPGAQENVLDEGVGPSRVTMIPVGIDTNQFAVECDRAGLRRSYGLSDDAFVVLSVTTLNRHHKRVDHLIEEVARLRDPRVHLWIDGSLHPDGDPTLLKEAQERLGDRFHFSHVPSDRVGELFAMSDLMVSASLNESFGMSLVEAARSGLPVIAHDSTHFRWLLGDAAALVDMRRPGNLAAEIQQVMHDAARCDQAAKVARDVISRFSWDALRSEYLAMYQLAASELPAAESVRTTDEPFAQPAVCMANEEVAP